MNQKTCSTCKIIKPTSEYWKNNTRDGFRSQCRDCCSIYQKIYHEKNKERKRSYSKAYHPEHYKKNKERLKKQTLEYQRKNPELRFKFRLKRIYKLTVPEYERILALQNGVCAICKEFKLHANKTRLSIDHCHITGKVRGLLCDNCNKGIGLLKDNKELVFSAYEYLSKC